MVTATRIVGVPVSEPVMAYFGITGFFALQVVGRRAISHLR